MRTGTALVRSASRAWWGVVLMACTAGGTDAHDPTDVQETDPAAGDPCGALDASRCLERPECHAAYTRTFWTNAYCVPEESYRGCYGPTRCEVEAGSNATLVSTGSCMTIVGGCVGGPDWTPGCDGEPRTPCDSLTKDEVRCASMVTVDACRADPACGVASARVVDSDGGCGDLVLTSCHVVGSGQVCRDAPATGFDNGRCVSDEGGCFWAFDGVGECPDGVGSLFQCPAD